jgi:CBS domain-containing protein
MRPFYSLLGGACMFCASSAYDDDYDAFFVSNKPELRKMWSEFFALDKFKNALIGQVLTKAISRLEGGKCISHPAYIGNSSLDALEQMARLGAHRVPVLADAGRVHSLVTQSMFISLFTQQIHRLGRLKHTLVTDMVPYFAKSPWQVNEDTLAINAFKLMAKHNVSGLGVVDNLGCLVGTISVSDLHGMGCRAEHFERLWYPVRLFIRDTQPNRTPPTVLLLDTLETVIRTMRDGDIHLVFVVSRAAENSSVPLHVITQRDVLKYFCMKMGVGLE